MCETNEAPVTEQPPIEASASPPEVQSAEPEPRAPERKTRVISLTNRRPVRIFEDEWPVIAGAEAVDFLQSENKWSVHVRQNAAGDCIVYGIRECHVSMYSAKAGEIIPAKDTRPTIIAHRDHVPWAIRRVCESLHVVGPMADRCIASLPAEDVEVTTDPDPESIAPKLVNRDVLLRFLRSRSGEDFDNMGDAVVDGEDDVFEGIVDEYLAKDPRP
jgi:hypothetical protein